MQAIKPLPSSTLGCFDSFNEYVEVSSKITEDFGSKLFIGDSNAGFEESPTGGFCSEEVVLEDEANHECDQKEDEEQEEEEEFSFACANPDGLAICADDVFQNGEIRPVFPIFNRDLLLADADEGGRPPLRKFFVEEEYNRTSSSASESDELEGVPEGTYCEWSGKGTSSCKKSNSTGFSRLWRFRDLVHRSNSDGKDAFVFLNPNNNSTRITTRPSNEAVKKTERAEEERKKSPSSVKVTAVKGKAKGRETTSSAHERHYVRNRAKREEDKRRSYLPYRQDLVGFFTNMNGLSRNVHPY
ncbi:hypothetical protein FNV43_RR26004 [Rhamnella rubrinervis]|uniref:Uncharacterized protein n=1 Tax=Rhamnella rubrinervis TaxID=2594499 RepID=A0A8K0GM32_9ROSA|nr:hypothetical protein FNV43_RR26004 [Rhamnella rubrinervis]